MIVSVRSNQPQFRQVNFTSGFNIVVAERADESSKKESRNGLGKTTLLHIIDFCLGSSVTFEEGIYREALRDWVFIIDIRLRNEMYTVQRSVTSHTEVFLEGNFDNWPIKPKIENGLASLSIRQWRDVLGVLLFDLSLDEDRKYKPTYRSLISYFIRIGREAYITPFEHFRKQAEWDIQVNNAFLLGLGWEYASRWQVLKDKETDLKNLRKLASSGSTLVTDLLGTMGELEADRMILEEQVAKQRQQIELFQVHPEYEHIRTQADLLTRQIHDYVNQNMYDTKTITSYESSIKEEHAASEDRVQDLYLEAGIELPELVLKRLEEVNAFHKEITKNRKEFLQSEINRLRNSINERSSQIRVNEREKASLLSILQTHGAIAEQTKLREIHQELVSKLQDVIRRIDALRKFEQEKASRKIEREQLLLDAIADHENRLSVRQRSVSLFNSNSQALYDVPGSLIVNISNTGFKFNVEIMRGGSDGVQQMGKVFTYDLTLAQLWSEKPINPGFLIHDSAIFDGVDERQRAAALQLAYSRSLEAGFQYICCINSDQIPYSDLDNFDVSNFIQMRLTDHTPEGGLLGIRF